jgi:hypothetical protein
MHDSMLNLQVVEYQSGKDPTKFADISVGQLGDSGRPVKDESCYHPALISTIQFGKYIYFFTCGKASEKRQSPS